MNDIRDRYRDFEVDEPQGLWDDIRRRLPQTPKRQTNILLLWTKRTMAVAAVLALAFLVTHFALNETATVKQQMAQVEGKVNQGAVTAKASMADAAPLISTTDKQEKSLAKVENIKQAELLPNNQTDTNENLASSVEVNAPAPDVSASAPIERQREEPQKAEKEKKPSVRSYPARNEQRHSASLYSSPRFSLALSATGAGGHSQNHFTQATPNASMGSGPETDWEEDPRDFLTQLNKGLDAETEIKHRQPFRLGLTFAYGLTSRLSLESGLTYTRLVSDLKDGSEYYYLTGRQTLHYVGIPLNVNVRLLTLQRFSLYWSAGVLAEKCVGGKVETEYVAEDEPSISETEHYTTRPYQFSAHTAIGAQYNVLPSLSLYAQPGMGYYFDDSSSLRTLYKEHPLTFNFEIGIRLSWGK